MHVLEIEGVWLFAARSMMDDSVLAQFQSTFFLGGEVAESRGPHPHYSLYKQKKDSEFTNQEKRRRKFLEEQVTKRRDCADLARKIAEGGDTWEDNDAMEEEDLNEVDGGEVATAKRRKDRYPYRNQLMLSEWLVEIPSDFEENWLVVVVPVGRRSLIVSARKTTHAYSRSGAMINHFPSLLPGGSRQSHRVQRDYCILDCIFDAGTQSFHILDVMCWGGHPVYDSDLEFRTFWKEQKCKENTNISTYSRINPLTFHDLPYHPCTRESLTSLLSNPPPYQVDGLLFIHKECQYVIGTTPLATWLKPRMVPDILGVPVSPEFLAKSPEIGQSGNGKMDTSKGPINKVKMEVSDQLDGELSNAKDKSQN